jgi:hypothetical protein
VRVALDSGYDRLTVRHVKRYACPECSKKKEQERKRVAGKAGGTKARTKSKS